MYGMLDQLMGAELPQMELYFEIGRAVCTRPEKGAAVMAAEYLQANYPGGRGFSPRNLRRMREFHRTYANHPELLELALKLGWTQNAAILEECEDSRERAWYLRAALEHRWTKAELLGQIQAGVWLQSTLDEQPDSCYTEGNTVCVECQEHEEDPFCVSRQDLTCYSKWPDIQRISRYHKLILLPIYYLGLDTIRLYPTPRRASERQQFGELRKAYHTSDPALLPSSTRTPAPSVAGHQRPDLIASHPLNNKKSGPGLEKSEKTACAPSQIAI